MTYSTYSLQDLSTVASHPAMGTFSLMGEGLVSITYGRANDMSAQDVGGDGSVMTSKVAGKNGLVTVVVQQTSSAWHWFTRLNNYLENASSSEFTRLRFSSSSRVMGKSHQALGCSPQKQPDSAYAAQGGQETFVYMAQQIEAGVA